MNPCALPVIWQSPEERWVPFKKEAGPESTYRSQQLEGDSLVLLGVSAFI